MRKILILLVLMILMTSCVTVYKNSTVMQYKGSAEMQTDSLKISLNNKTLNMEESK